MNTNITKTGNNLYYSLFEQYPLNKNSPCYNILSQKIKKVFIKNVMCRNDWRNGKSKVCTIIGNVLRKTFDFSQKFLDECSYFKLLFCNFHINHGYATLLLIGKNCYGLKENITNIFIHFFLKLNGRPCQGMIEMTKL